MIRTKWPRRQIGIKLNMGLWKEIKMIALEQERTATEVLEDAMREYIKEHPPYAVTDRPPLLKKGGGGTQPISQSGKNKKVKGEER